MKQPINYGKGFEAYELINKMSWINVIQSAFANTSAETVSNMIQLKRSHNRWSDFYYALDGYHQSMFDIYLDDLIK